MANFHPNAPKQAGMTTSKNVYGDGEAIERALNKPQRLVPRFENKVPEPTDQECQTMTMRDVLDNVAQAHVEHDPYDALVKQAEAQSREACEEAGLLTDEEIIARHGKAGKAFIADPIGAGDDWNFAAEHGAGNIQQRTVPGYRTVFNAGEPIVSMLAHKDRVFVATAMRIYELRDGNLEPIKFVVLPADIETSAP